MIGIAYPELKRDAPTPLHLLAASFSALTALGVLAGWQLNIDVLTRVIPGSIAMNPATAVVVLALALALLCQSPRQVPLGRFLASIAVLAGTAKVCQFWLGTPVGIDQILFADELSRVPGVPANRMAPNTAVALAALGWALLLKDSRSRTVVTVSQLFCVGSAAIAVVAAVGYALDVVALYQVHNYIAMAVPTTTVILVLSLAVLSVRPEVGLGRVFADRGPAGGLARTALPFALLVPLCVGVVARVGHEAGWYGLEAASAVSLIANVIVNFFLLGGCIVLLFRSDEVRKRRETALAESESQYREAERVANIGYWKLDVATKAVQWSDGFRKICGLSDATPPSINAIITACHPDDALIASDFIAQAHCGNWEFACRVQRPDGNVRHVRSHGVTVSNSAGIPTAILGVFSDVTELEMARHAAETAKETTASFLAHMSHEIRTPMNGVMGFVELLLLSDLDDSQRRHLLLIQDSARALLKLLNDVLDISKMEAGRLEIVPFPFNVRHGITQCVRLMTPLAEQKGLALDLDFDERVPASLIIDGLRMRQILLNLIGNAVKFTNDGSVTVRVSCEVARSEEVLQITVTDTGVGIPADRLDSIFDTFVQGEGSTTRRFGGSGLGLTISRSLAEMMGGAVRVQSVVGQGTSMTLVLPIKRGDSKPADGVQQTLAAAPPLHRLAASPASILVVEDVDINRELFGEMLAELGHRFDFAEDGATACELARRLEDEPNAWDLILMDLQMPTMDGLTATRTIRSYGSRCATIPIIALTASAFEDEVRECHLAGMNDHLPKPASIEDLSKMINLWHLGAQPVLPLKAIASPPKSLHAKYTLRREFIRQRLAEISNQLLDPGQQDISILITEAAAAAHFLAGCAGMFAEATLGDVASATEGQLHRSSMQSPLPIAALQRSLQTLIDAITVSSEPMAEDEARRQA